MLAILASIKTARFWLKAAPYLLILAAVAGLVLWINGMRSKIDAQAARITAQDVRYAGLEVKFETEKQARTRDVAGLTALSSGLVAASSAKQRDQEALSHAIDVQHPQPVSAGLSALLTCLRAADQNRECSAAPGAGAGSATTAAGAH